MGKTNNKKNSNFNSKNKLYRDKIEKEIKLKKKTKRRKNYQTR